MAAALCTAFVTPASAQSLGGFVSPGELSEAHADLSGISNCLQCHAVGAGVSDTKCMACHDRVREQVAAREGFHSDKGTACESCHADHRGTAFDMIPPVEADAFDHTATGFALDGGHGRIDCTDCHTVEDVWTGLTQVCRDCHDDPHGAEVGREFLGECADCHDVQDWEALPLPLSVFDHTNTNQVDYVLHGQHTDVACESCHADFRFVPVASEACTDCHEDPHRDQFAPRTCEDCHSVERAEFRLRDFDHRRTDFPLVGPHQDVRCESCHGTGPRARYADLPHNTCETCHTDPHDGQFAPRDCDACHSPTLPTFALANFDHDATGFPLHGAHADVVCEACHGSGGAEGTFAGLDAENCDSCHVDVHQGRLGAERCDTCHVDGEREVPMFDHGLTAFMLDGAHTDASCDGCHGGPDRRVLHPVAHGSCLDCHADDDPHGDTAATATCIDCHVTVEWVDVSFDHDSTDFPLLGQHDGPACADCHTDPSFAVEGEGCATCHEADRPTRHYEGDCTNCHMADGWLPATLGDSDHAVTGFALHGAHATVSCDGCHGGEKTVGPFCSDCHADDDPHRNQLGNTCESCHNASNWFIVRYTHLVTGWPLRGAHRLAACQDCHAAGWVGTPTACRRCHSSDKPADVVHADPLTSECETCHRPYAWQPARWPHGDAR